MHHLCDLCVPLGQVATQYLSKWTFSLEVTLLGSSRIMKKLSEPCCRSLCVHCLKSFFFCIECPRPAGHDLVEDKHCMCRTRDTLGMNQIFSFYWFSLNSNVASILYQQGGFWAARLSTNFRYWMLPYHCQNFALDHGGWGSWVTTLVQVDEVHAIFLACQVVFVDVRLINRGISQEPEMQTREQFTCRLFNCCAEVSLSSWRLSARTGGIGLL